MRLKINEEERQLLENMCDDSALLNVRDDIEFNKIKNLRLKIKNISIKEQFREAMKKYWIACVFIIFLAYSMIHTYTISSNEYINFKIDQFERDNLSSFENQLEMSILNDFYTMNAEYDTCDTYTKKRDFHKRNAERCFNDAKNMCWYFPAKFRDKSLITFSNIVTMGSPGDLKSKLISILVTTLIELGADSYEEWINISTKLKWTKHHWEMYEFYSDVVQSGSLRLNQ